MRPRLAMGILVKGLGGIDRKSPAPPTTTVLMNGLSSSCVLVSTTVPTAISTDVRRVASGGLARLAQLPTGAPCMRGPVMSTPRITISVASVLLCAE